MTLQVGRKLIVALAFSQICLVACGNSFPGGVTDTISVSPASIATGASATLTWSSTGAASCVASGAWSGAQSTSGSQIETPAAAGTFVYTLTCTAAATDAGTAASASNTATLTVTGTSSSAGSVVVSNAKKFTYASAAPSGSNLSAADLIAVDGSGNIWAGSLAYSSLVEIRPATAVADCSAGCTNFAGVASNGTLGGLAIDKAGKIWVGSHGGGSVGSPSINDRAVGYINATGVTNVYPNSTEVSGSSNSATVFKQAAGASVAIDNGGNVIVAGAGAFNQDGSINYTLELVTIDGAGNVLTNFPAGAEAMSTGSSPGSVAADAAGNVWTTFGANVVKFPAASGSTPIVYSSATLNITSSSGPNDLAIDNAGNAWVVSKPAGGNNGSVTRIAPTAAAGCASGCTTYASSVYLEGPAGVAVDGSNNVWVTTSVNNVPGPGSTFGTSAGVVEIQAGAAVDCSTGCTAYLTSAFQTSNAALGGIAIDSAGNVWVESYFDSSVIELPKIAAATVTPIAAQTR